MGPRHPGSARAVIARKLLRHQGLRARRQYCPEDRLRRKKRWHGGTAGLAVSLRSGGDRWRDGRRWWWWWWW